ncbi:hypothetical protein YASMINEVIRUS_988 [Yasminevirus sp. GU-2018]|uniref:Uncharacterized protein n=1 Tax=Yasminevirus sp. GU-2018 TaxID=2420051 RepID=A0A5K0U9U5_9VIRU|nr:hypothetical protein YASMINEVIRUS_988 [Yasminevirus sp. GU-2018]
MFKMRAYVNAFTAIKRDLMDLFLLLVAVNFFFTSTTLVFAIVFMYTDGFNVNDSHMVRTLMYTYVFFQSADFLTLSKWKVLLTKNSASQPGDDITLTLDEEDTVVLESSCASKCKCCSVKKFIVISIIIYDSLATARNIAWASATLYHTKHEPSTIVRNLIFAEAVTICVVYLLCLLPITIYFLRFILKSLGRRLQYVGTAISGGIETVATNNTSHDPDHAVDMNIDDVSCDHKMSSVLRTHLPDQHGESTVKWHTPTSQTSQNYQV